MSLILQQLQKYYKDLTAKQAHAILQAPDQHPDGKYVYMLCHI